MREWSPSAPIQVGSGFSGAYAKLLLPGDVNGDHKPDLIGVNSNGTLVYMPGNCTGAFGAPVTIAGVTVTSATAVGDFSGDGKPDVVDVHANGTMWMLRSNGSGGFSAATQIGDGWSSITPIGIGDPTGDGHADIGGWTSDGLILLYPGDGSGGWTPDAGYATGGAFAHATTQQVFGSTLLDNGYFDVDAITTSGSLVALAGSAIPGYDTSTTTLGSGWTNPIVQIAT